MECTRCRCFTCENTRARLQDVLFERTEERHAPPRAWWQRWLWRRVWPLVDQELRAQQRWRENLSTRLESDERADAISRARAAASDPSPPGKASSKSA